jgi:glycine/D-amino acid oxidase-like deaminating enzyme
MLGRDSWRACSCHDDNRSRFAMTIYGRSPWIHQFPKSRVPAHPRYRGASDAEVVIIGGGLTGCAAAYAFTVAGVKVTLLEAVQIGRGSSGSASGWLNDDPGTGFAEFAQAFGVRGATRAFQSWRRASLDFASLLRRLDVKCFIAPHPAVTVAMTGEQAVRLKREQKARRDAGLDASLLNARAVSSEVGLGAAAGMRLKDGATLDPYRACLGLAAAAAQRGAQLFERTPVQKVTFNRKTADVVTATGRIRTKRVIVATGIPTPLYKSLARHFWFHTTYLVQTAAVPARIRTLMGRREAIVRDSAQPPHVIRWLGEDRVIVAGGDGDVPPVRLRDKVIVQRTGQLMYELSTLYPDISGIEPAFGWAADYARTTNGLPCIGPHRNFPHHLFAFGDSSPGVTGAYLASRIFLRYHLGEADRADDAFGFTR